MTSRDDEIAKAIRYKDVGQLLSLFFQLNPPSVKDGFKTETDLWDFKADAPHIGKMHANAWANCASDVLAFHNQRGGVVFYGIANDFSFVGATPALDSKLFNDQLRRFLPDTLWVEYHRALIRADQRYLGVAIIPPGNPPFARFIADAPQVNGHRLFVKGYSSIRANDSTNIISAADAESLSRKALRLNLASQHFVNEPFFRIPSPEYPEFIRREVACRDIDTALADPRTSVAHVIGIGGVGKTALATWAAINAYQSGQFSFIASCTAKDRELTASGIAALEPELTSFESLLNTVLEVLQFPDLRTLPPKEKEEQVRELLSDSRGLLYVDNLETVDDARIIQFLDSLPVGVRAIVTSRRLRVRVAVYPVQVGQFDEKETCAFIRSLAKIPRLEFASEMVDADLVKIGKACDFIPLAIRWLLSRAQSTQRAISEAEAFNLTGKRGEELLEFSFRRVFESMTQEERLVVEVLSLFQQPQPTEVVLIGSKLNIPEVQDALGSLMDDAIVQRVFDQDRNDDSYVLLPITRAFIYSNVSKRDGVEAQIRKRLSDYFDAKDVRNEQDRPAVREIRQVASAGDSALIDLAASAKRRGDVHGAADLLRQALLRNPKSWRAHREMAELHRHDFRNISEAIRSYEQACAKPPKDKIEHSKLHRELALLLRESGSPDGLQQAIDHLESALDLNKNDPITIGALAQGYDRRGAYLRVISLCEPLKSAANKKTKDVILPLLERAYRQRGDLIAALEITRLQR